MVKEAARTPSDFDPHFKIFHRLMSFSVHNILLISSPYDAYIMEEDGSITSQVIREYQGLSLSGAPMITRVNSLDEALEELRYRTFDLVITMPFLKGVNGFAIGRAVKEFNPALPVILIAHNLQSIRIPADERSHTFVDNVFLWNSGSHLLVAMVKNVEDHINVIADTARAMVRVIIYVEDSPVDRSYFLPLIYREVVWQTQEVLDESLNEKHRLLRMRARPKVLMATSYEEALSLYEAYKPFVFCVISDTRFTIDGRMDGAAGVVLLQNIRSQFQDLPLLLLSTETENRAKADEIPAVFIDKNSQERSQKLHDFFLEHLGFGEFVFRLPDQSEIGRAETIGDFERMLAIIPEDSLLLHARRNHFFNWIMARAEVAMAHGLHRQHLAEIEDGAALRRDLIGKVHALRVSRQKGVVVRFRSKRYDPEVFDFVKIGDGAIGGKARGLAFMWARLQNINFKKNILAQSTVTIPKTCVIAANGFDSFVYENNLIYDPGMNDEEIAARFLKGSLPDWLRDDLRIFTAKCRFPLSVRSSSLLEDGLFRPFAGLYSTYFLANNHHDHSVRLEELENAIKLIYASTWFSSPKAFAQNAGDGRHDAMAVIIQQVVGDRHGDYWYPAISGVAQSHNYYPILNMKSEEGIAHIALGIGKTVVEGEKSLRFSPAHPERLVQFSSVDDILDNAQNDFYALDMSENAEFNRRNSNLVLRQVQDAFDEFPVRHLSSTYIAEEHRIRDGYMPGIRVMTFAQVLKYRSYPLCSILGELLEYGREGMGCEVEMEFAVNLDPDDPENSVFHFLQMRPMVTGGEEADVAIEEGEIAEALCYSSASLGHGRIETCADILVVKPDDFDPARTKEIATEIGVFNRKLENGSHPYLLIGPGRWGSADRWLGIPVQWRDISGVSAIVEVRNSQLKAEPSQGSHFFQNITSLNIFYMTVTENAQNQGALESPARVDRIDWRRLLAAEAAESGRYVSHLRLEKPLTIKCNGKASEGIVLLDDGFS